MTTQYGVEYDLEMLYSGAANLERAASDLRKFARAADEVGREVDQANRKTGGGQSMFKQMTEGWADAKAAFDTVGTAIRTVASAVEGAYETLSRGAEMSRVSDQFDRLAESIGTTGDKLLAGMTEATSGMITQAELMESGVQMINLGLAGSADEVQRLSSVVGELGWNMDVLTLTIANKSMMRLDSLGLSIDDVKGRIEDFEEAGYSADEAFKWAIIEAGEDKVKVLGSAAETAAGKLAQIETAVTNMQDAFALGLAEGFFDNLNSGPEFAEAMAEGAEAAGDLGRSLGELAVQVMPALVKGAELLADGLSFIASDIEYTNFIKEMQESGKLSEAEIQKIVDTYWQVGQDAAMQMIDAYKEQWAAEEQAITDRATEAARASGEAWQAGIDKMAALEAEQLVKKETFDALTDKFFEAGGFSGQAYADNFEAQAAALEEADLLQQEVMEAKAAAIGKAVGEITAEAIGQAMQDSGDQFTTALDAFMDPEADLDFTQILYDSADAAGASASALAGLAIAMGDVSEEEAKLIIQQAFLIESLENLGRQIAEGVISPDEAFAIGAEMVENIQQGIDVTGSDLIYTLDPEVKVAEEAASRAAQELDEEMRREFEKLGGEVELGGSAVVKAETVPEINEEMWNETVASHIANMPVEDRTVTIETELDTEAFDIVVGPDGIGQIVEPEGGSHIAPITIGEEFYTSEIPAAVGSEGLGQIVDGDWPAPITIAGPNGTSFQSEIDKAASALDGLVVARTAEIRVKVTEERQPVEAEAAT